MYWYLFNISKEKKLRKEIADGKILQLINLKMKRKNFLCIWITSSVCSVRRAKKKKKKKNYLKENGSFIVYMLLSPRKKSYNK